MKSKLLIAVLTLLCTTGTTQQLGGDTLSIEEGLASRTDIIFFGGFEENFNNSAWESGWGIPWENRAADNEIIAEAFQGGHSLRVNYPVGGVGPDETGVQFPMVFHDMAALEKGFYNELYLRYYVKFEEGFSFMKGGKLPGLMGGGESWKRSGGRQPDGSNGWTLRFMWRSGGKLVVYAYVPKSENGKWGSDGWGQNIDCDFVLEPGQWHCIEQYVSVGSPDRDNGKLRVWVDNIEKLNISDLRFWNVENNDGRIGGMYFSTFHGGSSAEWAPLETSYIQFDGIVMAKQRVGTVGGN
jgi:hypothetical protein